MKKIKVSLILIFCSMLLSSLLFGQLTGIKYIGGTSPDYITLEAAISDLNSQGVGAGGVTFLICDGIYTENDNLIISDVTGTDENTVVFQPDVGATVEINITITATGNAGIRIHNSDYISFNGTPYGSNNESRNLRINGWRVNDDDEIPTIWVSNGSDYCSLKNLIIFNEDNTDRTGYSMPVYFSTYFAGEPLDGMESITLYNCEVIGGSTFGVYMDGEPGQNLVDFQIIKNDIHDFNKYGIYIYTNVINCNVEGNEVYQTIQGNTSVYGIRAGSSSCSGTKIHHNYIHDLWSSSTAKPYGIFITQNSHHNLIYNNIIYLYPEPTVNKAYGIYRADTDSTYNEFYYNTVYMGGISTIARSSYCFITYADYGGDIFKNNILINERTGGGNNHYAIKMKTETFDESDFNFLTVNSDDPADDRFVAQLGNTNYNTLEDLQNAPGYAPRDQNSLSGDPNLTFPDLHLDSISICIGVGTPIPGILTDFDYDLRDTSNPDIGADEFVPENHAPEITYFFPEDTAFAIEQNTEQLFSITANDADDDSLIYFWYINDAEQSENTNEFIHTFSDTGEVVIKALVSDSELADSTLWYVTIILLGTNDDNTLLPKVTKLHQNTPNPFNVSTTVNYELSQYTLVEINIYDVKGGLVQNLVNKIKAPGIYTVVWNGRNKRGVIQPSGLYFYQLKAGERIIETKRMLLLK
ncbi:T9SS type A sorting domain-containing protein [candidate division WOR-3 bacterium]|nr:T9SS type A sorting domain-containing protein [candidate division WOR-3 bacterium]